MYTFSYEHSLSLAFSQFSIYNENDFGVASGLREVSSPKTRFARPTCVHFPFAPYNY